MTEGSSSNLFIVQDGRIVTAPAGRYILRGITRDIVLELAEKDDIPVEERFFSKEELLAAEEAFITSTTMEVMPVVRGKVRSSAAGRRGLSPAASHRRTKTKWRGRRAEPRVPGCPRRSPDQTNSACKTTRGASKSSRTVVDTSSMPMMGSGKMSKMK